MLILERSDFGYWNLLNADVVDFGVDVLDDIVLFVVDAGVGDDVSV